MALAQGQLHANAKITLADKEYTVEETNARLTYLSNPEDESGGVVVYRTDVVTQDADVWVDPTLEQQLQEQGQTEDQRRIRDLEAQLADVRAHQAASQPAPGNAVDESNTSNTSVNEGQ